MNRLKNAWTTYKQLGVHPDQDGNTKRRIMITNMMSFALAIALLVPASVVLTTQLPSIFLAGILQAFILCLLTPLLNHIKRNSTAAILFSVNLPLLILTSNLLHKTLMPIEQLVESDYYRSHFWLIFSTAFPFISIDPKQRRLQTALASLPVLMIFGLNFLYRLFDRDFETLGFDIVMLFRQNVVATIVSILIILVFLFLEDITNSMRKELQIKADEVDQLSFVAQETTNAVAIFDQNGNFEWVNKGFVKIYEQTIDELLVTEGLNLFETIPNSYHRKEGRKTQTSDEVESILSAINGSITDKKPVHYEYYTVTKSGKQIIVQTTLTPFLDPDGNIKKLICIDSDISKLKKAEEKIRVQKDEIQSQAEQLKAFNEHLEELVNQRTQKIQEQNKKLLEYAFSNSHLVRAPLARILGLTELLDSDTVLSPEVKGKLLINIRISALELDEIIRDMGQVIADDLPGDKP